MYIWKGVNCHFWLLNILYTELDKKQGIEKFMISRIFCAWKKLKMYNLLAKSNSYMDIVSNFSLMQIFWEGQKSPNGFLIMWPSQNIWTKTKSADVVVKMAIEFSPLEIM